ncbi:MAG: hypothetical protein MRY79_06370 [Alphaproteobacteria bacterium]|nr:hypothetical protein [Alphaproteobacteria bacterium]
MSGGAQEQNTGKKTKSVGATIVDTIAVTAPTVFCAATAGVALTSPLPWTAENIANFAVVTSPVALVSLVAVSLGSVFGAAAGAVVGRCWKQAKKGAKIGTMVLGTLAGVWGGVATYYEGYKRTDGFSSFNHRGRLDNLKFPGRMHNDIYYGPSQKI